MNSRSWLKEEAEGIPVLIVYYDQDLKDWDARIAEAYRKHGLQPGKVTVMAYPKRKRQAKKGTLTVSR